MTYPKNWARRVTPGEQRAAQAVIDGGTIRCPYCDGEATSVRQFGELRRHCPACWSWEFTPDELASGLWSAEEVKVGWSRPDDPDEQCEPSA